MRTLHQFLLLAQGVAFLAIALQTEWSVASDDESDSFFESKVRPLLVKRCLECHGEKKAGGLRLDSREGWKKGGDSGPALVPGKPEQSLLVEAVGYGSDIKMPPQGKLLDTEIATLKRWIELGAPWTMKAAGDAVPVSRDYSVITDEQRRHWSFQPILPLAPPDVRNVNWIQRSLDRFILARLEAAGLTPAPPANKRVWLRRVSFDLTGLPPTLEDVADFLSDDAPQSCERVVERLLASPQYGEHWARHWLDVVRYADSSGKDENNSCANAFRYRDYVVQSFNQDKPFDQFIREQIAGDLLPANSDVERFERLAATGFLQIGPKALAEQDKPKLLLDIVDEQIDAVGKAFLGLTVSCARCHDHKLEPIPQRDYYALAGIFRGTRSMATLQFVSTWYEHPLANQQTLDLFAAHAGQLRQNQAAIDARIAAANAELVQRWRKAFSRYLLTAQKLRFSFAAAAITDPKAVRASVFELARSEGLVGVVLERWFNLLAATQTSGDPFWKLWHQLAAIPAGDFAPQAPKVVQQFVSEHPAQDPTPATAAQLVSAKFREFAPGSLADVADKYAQIAEDVDAAWQVAQNPHDGKPKLDILTNLAQEELRQLLYGNKGLFGLLATPSEHYPPDTVAALADLERQKQGLKDAAPPPIPEAMGVVDGTAESTEFPIGDVAIAIRGNHLNLGEKVPRGYLRIVSVADAPPPSSKQSGRLELAEWIASPRNPLTARVIVNRVWGWHFGHGLCRTPDNLGLTGQPPSHPELLDALAAQFISGGWSLKQLHREICLSSTYRMSGQLEVKTPEADPENLLRWQFQRRRLAAEEMRDALLAVSGQIDLTVGGNLFNYANREPHVTHFKGPVNYDFRRRSLYLPVVRNVMYDLFDLFDHGDALSPLGQRSQTTVATQALYWMNAPLVLQAAEHLAGRVLSSGAESTESRIVRLYQFAFYRDPDEAEMVRLSELVVRLDGLLSAKESDPVRRERLVWQACCQSVLASNEFMTVD